MLEIRKTSIALDEAEQLDLESIITASDEKEAFNFLNKSVYDKLVRTQRGK